MLDLLRSLLAVHTPLVVLLHTLSLSAHLGALEVYFDALYNGRRGKGTMREGTGKESLRRRENVRVCAEGGETVSMRAKAYLLSATALGTGALMSSLLRRGGALCCSTPHVSIKSLKTSPASCPFISTARLTQDDAGRTLLGSSMKKWKGMARPNDAANKTTQLTPRMAEPADPALLIESAKLGTRVKVRTPERR